MREALRLAPEVTRLIEIQRDAVIGDVNNVAAARAVDVGKVDALGVEQIWPVKDRRVAHRHLGAEAAVAEVGPVADFVVADAHDIRKAIAAHIRKEYRLVRIGKYQLGAFFLIPGFCRTARGAEALLRLGFVPGEDRFFRNQDIRMAVAGDVYEPDVGIFGVDIRNGLEPRERLPASGCGALMKTGHRSIELHQFQMAFSGQIEQLLATGQCRRHRSGHHHLRCAECSIAEAAFVIPGVGLLRKNAGQPLALQIDPLIAAAINTVGQIFDAFGIDLMDGFIHLNVGVLELEFRQGFFEVALVRLLHITGLGH